MLNHTHDVVREQANGISKSIRSFSPIAREVVDFVEPYFARGRRLTGEGLLGLVKGIHEKVTDEVRPIRSRADVRRATPARPKGEAYELLYAILYPESRIGDHQTRFYRLSSLRVLASRKRVVLECMPIAMGFKEHAAHRFVGRGADVNNAVRNLGSSLVEWAALPGLVEQEVLEAGHRRLAIPAQLGMMMGVLDTDAHFPNGQRFTLGHAGCFPEDIMTARPLATYVVNTFIGRNEIHPNQRGAAAFLERWRDDCREEFALDCDDVLWPRRELLAAAISNLSGDDVQAIRNLIVEDRMLKAMGNIKPLSSVEGAGEVSQESDGEPAVSEFEAAPLQLCG